MSHPDDNNGELEELKIDRQRRVMLARGEDLSGGARMEVRDKRFDGLIAWSWIALGGIAVSVGWGVYNKLSSINDTLIVAVSDIKNLAVQNADLKAEVRELRAAQASTQRQLDSLEGKTLRGIEEISRGH